jgi:hypothetical protein
VLEEFQVFLEFATQGSTQNSVGAFSQEVSPNEGEFYYRNAAGGIIKTMETIGLMFQGADFRLKSGPAR